MTGDHTVRLWDTLSWQELRVLRGHEDEVYSIRFARDGRKLVSGGKDDTVRIWSTEMDRELRESYEWPAESWLIPPRPSAARQLQIGATNGMLTSLGFFDLNRLQKGTSTPVPAELRL